jgi:hypothetical protein
LSSIGEEERKREGGRESESEGESESEREREREEGRERLSLFNAWRQSISGDFLRMRTALRSVSPSVLALYYQ